jgi:hypothetical protein
VVAPAGKSRYLVASSAGRFSPIFPAPGAALEDVAVMEETVEHSGHRGGVAEDLPQSSTGRFEVKTHPCTTRI